MRLTRNQMKYAAYFLMLLDHIGAVFFPGAIWLRALGRLSFPFFAYLLAEGVCGTSDWKKYLYRLAGLALLSEPFYDLLFYKKLELSNQNIYFTLLLGAAACFFILRYREKLGLASYLLSVPFFILAWIMRVDYDVYGIFLIVGFLLMKEAFWQPLRVNRYLLVLICGCFVTMARGGLPIQNLSIAAGFVMPVREKEEQPLSKLWYFFYPTHLFALLVLYLLF